MAVDAEKTRPGIDGRETRKSRVHTLRIDDPEPSRIVVHAARVAITAAFIGAWQLASDHKLINPFFISSPSRVGSELWNWILVRGRTSPIGSVSLYHDINVTMHETLIGFGIGFVAGVLIGFLLAEVRLLDRIFQPLLNLLNTLPRVALAPLFIVWFGIGEWSKIVLVVSVVVFIMMFNTYAGAKTVDRDIVTVTELLGANAWQRVRTVTLPWCLPWIFTGARLSLAWALGAAVIGEYLASSAGVGYRIFYYAGILDNTGVLSGCIVLLGIALALFSLLSLIERRVLRWRTTK